jgi:hypothetical protein
MELNYLMDKKAVDAARKEYDRAVEQAIIIRESSDFASIQSAWSAFLVANGRVFTKLEQGSKSSSKSRAWWGRKLGQRRKDALLCYLWHARNTDEHTIEEITERHDTTVAIVQPKPGIASAMERGLIGRPIAPLNVIETTSPSVRLLDVVDKGTLYLTPGEHLGANLLKAHVAAHRDNAVMCRKPQPSRHRRNPSEPVSSSRKPAGITAKRRNAGVPRGADAGLEPFASDSCGGGQPPLTSSWSPPTYP